MKVLLSTLVLIFVSSSNIMAEELRYYDVEIIVIENQAPDAKKSEHWPLEVNINKPENTVELGLQPPTEWLPIDADFSISFKALPPEAYQLNAEIEKISQSSSQRVIFHRAWRQPGLDKKIAMPVYFKKIVSDTPLETITHEKITDLEYNNQANDTSSNNTAAEIPGIDNEFEASTLEGIFRVTLSRYLHLEAELVYREKLPVAAETEYSVNNEGFFGEITSPVSAEEKQGVIYLKQTRHRMKSNELHYIDHPVLGILVKITPYVKPEVETAPAQ